MSSKSQQAHALIHHSPAEKAAQRDLDEAAYRLRCAENLTYKQVAERVGCDSGTAWQRCQRAEKRAIASSADRCTQEALRHHERLLALYAEALADYRAGHQVKQLRAALAVLDRIQTLWRLDTIAPPAQLPQSVNVGIVNTLDPAWVAQVTGRPLASPTPPEGTALPNPLPDPSLASIAPCDNEPTPAAVENTPPPA